MKPHTVVFALAYALLIFAGAIVFAQSNAVNPAHARTKSTAPDVAANWITTGNKIQTGEFLGTKNNQPLIFKTNKVERMRLDTLGNVGIGTNAPGSKLTVAGVVQSTSGGFKFPDGTTQTTASVAGSNSWGLGGNAGTNPSTNFVGTTDNQALVFRTNNAERVRIGPTGNVGIGMTAPGNRLDVQGSVSTFNGVALGLYNANDGNTNKWAVGTGGAVVPKDAFSIGDSSSNKMTILANGRVGIGTTTPAARLTIKGPDTSPGTLAFEVLDSTGLNLFSILGLTQTS